MDIHKISVGPNPPHALNVIIEVPQGGDAVKYEMDKESGALLVDRLLQTAMHYPCHYGFVPHTLSADGDPLDVLVLCPESLMPGCVMGVRPIGVLIMEDEAGRDEKILAVPIDKISPIHSIYKTHEDVPDILLQKITHFFAHYKDLEKNKWVKVVGWEGVNTAHEIIEEAIQMAQSKA